MDKLPHNKSTTYLKTLPFTLLTTVLFACDSNGSNSLPGSDTEKSALQ